jgi:hypothetical protein
LELSETRGCFKTTEFQICHYEEQSEAHSTKLHGTHRRLVYSDNGNLLGEINIIIITTTVTTTTTTTNTPTTNNCNCHSVAVVLTLVQTKQTRINVHKRNNTKNTVQKIQNTVNTSTHITKTPTHTQTHTNYEELIKKISFIMR